MFGACLMSLNAGCTIIFSGDDFAKPEPDAAPVIDSPPPIDAPPLIDANPSLLTIDRVEPDTIAEGTGSELTGRPVPIIIHGANFTPGAVISLMTPAKEVDAGVADAAVSDAAVNDAGITPTGAPVLGASVVSSDGTMIATTIAIPVRDDLADGESETYRLVVSQQGHSADVDLTVTGLDELTLAPGTLTVSAGTLKPAYSRIVIDQNVHAIGAAPVRLFATAEIVVSATLDANGAQNGTAGAGGCAGGTAEGPGGCGTGGGGPGSGGGLNEGAGGGGGGFGVVGTGGSGGNAMNPAGAGGMPTGSEMLIPIATNPGEAGNRGNGGGGGGDGLLGGAPGGGGGGGGTLELRTTGVLHFTAGGLSANGGPGANGTGLGGGGGGGGSGGAILLAAAAGIVNDTGGTVCQAGGGGGGNRGGAGGAGRVRIDAPTVDMGLVNTPVPVFGPIIRSDAPAVVSDSSTVMITVAGEASRSFAMTINDVEQPLVTPGQAHTATVAAALTAGMNRVCVFATTTVDFRPEAVMCRDIAYLP